MARLQSHNTNMRHPRGAALMRAYADLHLKRHSMDPDGADTPSAPAE